MSNKKSVDVTTVRNGKVRCVGYKMPEKYFTIGKVYEVKDDQITADNGYTYKSENVMKFLSRYYEFELVDAPKFKVGDKVIGNHPTRYGITKKGWIGEVQEVRPDSIYVYGKGIECTMGFWVDPQYFDLYNEEKIVITHDGKTTTATKYCADGSKVTATAKCAPEDKFDFNVGAKLAMERLMAKIEPPVEWRVVNRTPRVGDYIRLKTNGYYEFNKPGDILKVDVVKGDSLVSVYGKNHIRDTGDPDYLWNYEKCEYEIVEKVNPEEKSLINKFQTGDYAKIIANKWGNKFEIGTIVRLEKRIHNYSATDENGKSWFVLDDELEAYTPPKYYSGKVVCILGNGCWWTKGKIYTFVNGTVVDNDGDVRYRTKPVTDIASMKNRFLPIVE